MSIFQQEQQVVLQTYKRFPLFIVRGKGVHVWDDQENKYLDFLAGIAVNALGHCHPVINQAIQQQINQLGHVSNFYYTGPMITLAQKLAVLSGLDKVFWSNSGAEANETAIKLARKFDPKRWEIITCENSFHGRTLAAVSATGQLQYQKGFEPLVPGFKYIPYNNLPALEAAISEKTAAFLVEPIQGEGGVKMPNPDYLEKVRHICDKKNVLLIIDEVQTGCGRTGTFFNYEQSKIKPDIVTLAKALGAGLPIGACIAAEAVAAAFQFGDHGSTFGGNPVCCATALAFIHVLETENLIKRCNILGRYLIQRLRVRLHKYSPVKEIRGKGLMVGIELNEEVASSVVQTCFDEKLLLASAGKRVVRMLPPYIITKKDIDQAVKIIERAIGAAMN